MSARFATSLPPEALALRLRRLTGTTAAAALGVHPRVSEHAAWRQVMGLEQVEPTEAMRWGLRLQPFVAIEFEQRHGVELDECVTRVHPEYDWLACTGDYRIPGSTELVEVKTTNDRNREHWGPDGTDQVPEHYFVQCLVQMAVYDATGVWLAVLIGGQEYREYHLVRDLHVERTVLERLAVWHALHIAGGVEPAGSAADRLAALEARFPQSDGDVVEAPPEAEPFVELWRSARLAKKYAEAQEAEARAGLCALIGANAGIAAPGWRCTWKAPRPTQSVDWKAVALAAGATPELIAAHTSAKANSRRFAVRIDGEKGDE